MKMKNEKLQQKNAPLILQETRKQNNFDVLIEKFSLISKGLFHILLERVTIYFPIIKFTNFYLRVICEQIS